MKIVVTGDDLMNDRKQSIITLNHRTRLDWMFIWMLHSRFRILSQLKIVLKSSLKRIPGPGEFSSLRTRPEREIVVRRLGDATRCIPLPGSRLGERQGNDHQY